MKQLLSTLQKTPPADVADNAVASILSSLLTENNRNGNDEIIIIITIIIVVLFSYLSKSE